MTLDQLLEITDNCKLEINELPWNDDDVRHSFFGFYYSTIYDYYIGKTVFRLVQLIGDGNVLFKGEIYDFNKHVIFMTPFYLEEMPLDIFEHYMDEWANSQKI